VADKQLRSSWALPDRSLHHKRVHKEPKQPATLAHYPNIILYVYQSRYATVDHIFRRFHGRIKSLRTAQYQAARLVDLGYLKTMDVSSTGPNFPHVYVATGRGISYVRKTFNVELLEGREEASSLPSITHELFLTAFELACYQTVKARGDLTLKFTERRYYHQTKSLIYGPGKRLIPDASFLLAIRRPPPKPPAHLFYFVELDNGTELASVVLIKFQKYATWTNSKAGQQYLLDIYANHGAPNPKPNYRLLVVARRQDQRGQDKRRLCDLFAQAMELPPDIRQRLWFATVDDIQTHEHDAEPLAAQVWLRVRDTDSWLSDYQAFVATLPTGAGHRPNVRKQEYVAKRIATMPRHSAIPKPQT